MISWMIILFDNKTINKNDNGSSEDANKTHIGNNIVFLFFLGGGLKILSVFEFNI